MDNRQIDVLVAEKIFNAKVEWVRGHPYSYKINDPICPTCGYSGHWNENSVPDYTTDILAAWQVVEKMHKDGMKFSISSFYQVNVWYASFLSNDKRVVEAKEGNPALAICLAALKAVGVEIEDTKSSM